MTGLSPDADLYAVKVLDKDTNGKYSTVVKGIDWAIEHKVNIILMSLGGKKESVFLKKLLIKHMKKEPYLSRQQEMRDIKKVILFYIPLNSIL